jgi:integrase
MLSDAKLRALKPRERPYKVSDREGLFVLVSTNGSRLWRFAYRFGGKQKLLALGKYPDVSLGDARDKLRDARKLLSRDIDPSEKRKTEEVERREIHANTFQMVANEWFETNKSRWVESYSVRLRSRLDEDLIPALGKRPISLIRSPEVLEAIRKVEARDAPEMARRILQMARLIFHYGIATGRCQIDPTIGISKALRPPKPVKSRTALKAGELPEFLASLQLSELDKVTKTALEFTLLTFVRTAEVRFAEWGEFEGLDGPAPLWRIPASRMKMRREHLVPLAPRAVKLIKDLQTAPKSPRLVFAMTPSKPVSENTMLFGLYRMGFHGRATIHGFRSTASTILNENGFNRDWIEKQLAHEDSSVRSVYNAAEWLDGRRTMMSWWADYLERAATTRSVRLTA